MTTHKDIDLARIRMLVMDVDGVLTDGSILLHADGSESKTFNVQDGHGVKLWHRAGLKSAILSGREAPVVLARARQLGIGIVLQGQLEKLPAYETILKESGLTAQETAYIGDDVLDLPLVRRAGFGVAVANAVGELKAAADYVTAAGGGRGAIREVIEYILRRTGRWDQLMERYRI